MAERDRIRDQLHWAARGEAWHGPSVAEVLAGVTAQAAAARPISGAHTIAELLEHLSAWTRVVLRRLDGERLDSLPDAEDFPRRTLTAGEWEQAQRHFFEAQDRLEQAVGRLADAQLDAIVPGKDYSMYVMLHGVAQHLLYHAGQMAVLKKALA